MFRETSSADFISISNSETNYCFICNTLDKTLTGKKNNSLINILCENELIPLPYGSGLNNKLGSINNFENIFYLYSCINGGKGSITDKRTETFIKCLDETIKIIQAKNIDTRPISMSFDYSNLIIDTESNYAPYKKILEEYAIKYDITIIVHFNNKIKKAQYVPKKDTLDLDNIIILGEYNITDIYFLEVLSTQL